MNCTTCNAQEATKSGIIQGTYHKDLCVGCYAALEGGHTVSSGHADYERREQGMENGWMAAQPRMKDGTPSREFIALYPGQAKKIFDADTLRKYS